MTKYAEILYGTLFLNVIAFAANNKRRKCFIINNNNYIIVLLRKNKWLTWLWRQGRGKYDEPTQHHDDDDDNAESCSSSMSQQRRQRQRHHNHLLYRIYLPVYLLAVCADWLQGPYKYAVYADYGYTQRDISTLFVAGYGSGMTMGSIIGGFADTYGRKRMVCWYCVCYIFSCLAKHFRPFGILLCGRILGGIATSLLFSVFDAWFIKASSTTLLHNNNNNNIDINKSSQFLSNSFAVANFGSSVVAILSGLVANVVVGQHTTATDARTSTLRPAFWKAARVWLKEEAEEQQEHLLHDEGGIEGEGLLPAPLSVNDKRWDVAWVYKGGGIVAFDLALVPLILCFVLALVFWEENYGDDDDNHNKSNEPTTTAGASEEGTTTNRKGHKKFGMFSGLYGASVTVWRSSVIFNLCAITSFFEGAMYVFVLLWTPALRALDKHPEDEDYPGPPLGIVFATFMVCCMLGTSIFANLTSRGIRPSRILVGVLALAAMSCLVIAYTTNDTTSYLTMLLFEGCIGAYYPAMSTVKGSIIPEDQRAAIYSVFRLPLNLVVLLILFLHLGTQTSFGVCTVMLTVATILQCCVMRSEEIGGGGGSGGANNSSHVTAMPSTPDRNRQNEMLLPMLKVKDSNVLDEDDGLN